MRNFLFLQCCEKYFNAIKKKKETNIDILTDVASRVNNAAPRKYLLRFTTV